MVKEWQPIYWVLLLSAQVPHGGLTWAIPFCVDDGPGTQEFSSHFWYAGVLHNLNSHSQNFTCNQCSNSTSQDHSERYTEISMPIQAALARRWHIAVHTLLPFFLTFSNYIIASYGATCDSCRYKQELIKVQILWKQSWEKQ